MILDPGFQVGFIDSSVVAIYSMWDNIHIFSKNDIQLGNQDICDENFIKSLNTLCRIK